MRRRVCHKCGALFPFNDLVAFDKHMEKAHGEQQTLEGEFV